MSKFDEFQFRLKRPSASLASARPSLSSRSEFNAAHVRDFLNNGWLLSLESNKLLIGWGEWNQASHRPPTLLSEILPETVSRVTEDLTIDCAIFVPDFRLQDEFQGSGPWRSTAHWTVIEREVLLSYFEDACDKSIDELVDNQVDESIDDPTDRLMKDPIQSQIKENQFHWSEPDPAEFIKSWDAIQEGFAFRGLRKAVPVVFSKADGTLNAVSRKSVLTRLLGAPASLHLYGFWYSSESTGEDQGILGATPEILYSKTGREVETVAVAGTRAKSGESVAFLSQEFLKDSKSRQIRTVGTPPIRRTR